MYSFANTIPSTSASTSNSTLPSEAMEWYGSFLEEKINGYRTLTVDGRDGFSRKINAPEKSGDGNLYLNSKFESRTITVTFMLESKSSADLVSKFDFLKRLLSRREEKFRFRDDWKNYYRGTVSKIENNSVGKLNIIGKITINCSDPFKSSTLTYFNGLVIRDINLFYAQTPKTLQFTAQASAPSVSISTNDGMKLIVNRGINNGQMMNVDFKELTVKYGSTSVLIDLDLRSNLGDFVIKNGTTFSTNPSGYLTIGYEVMQL